MRRNYSPRNHQTREPGGKALIRRKRHYAVLGSSRGTCLEFTISRRSAQSNSISCGEIETTWISFNWLFALGWSSILVLPYLNPRVRSTSEISPRDSVHTMRFSSLDPFETGCRRYIFNLQIEIFEHVFITRMLHVKCYVYSIHLLN